MANLQVVDAHMHLWDLARIRYPWLTPPLPVGITGDVSPIAHTYLIDDYLRDAVGTDRGSGGGRDAVVGDGGNGGGRDAVRGDSGNGDRRSNTAPDAIASVQVSKVVHVEAGANPADSLVETRWLQSVADERGFPHAIVAHAELNSPGVEALLEAHASHRNVRGVRQILSWHPDPAKTYTARDLLEDRAWQRGFEKLARLNLSFDLQIYPGQMHSAASLAAHHPDTTLILNHTGMPVDRDADGIEAWRSGMRALALQPNVSVKISGLAMLDWRWSVDSLRPFVHETLELFGPERCMFGSNFPVDRLFGSFGRQYDAYRTLAGGFSTAEQTKLFAGNAARIYRI